MEDKIKDCLFLTVEMEEEGADKVVAIIAVPRDLTKESLIEAIESKLALALEEHTNLNVVINSISYEVEDGFGNTNVSFNGDYQETYSDTVYLNKIYVY